MKTYFDYEFSPPVFKRGDDLGHEIANTKSLKEALTNQAASYKEAMEMCLQLAEFVDKNPEIQIDADCHMIHLSWPKENKELTEKVDKLVDEGLIYRTEYEDEEYDDEYEEDDLDEEE